MRTDYMIEDDLKVVMRLLTRENRLAMRVCLHTGLRVGDVLAMRPEQLKSRTSVREAKTGKTRRIGLPAELLADLKDNAGEHWVFPGAHDPTRHRTRQAVWKDVKRAARACRLAQNIGTHSARKIYAVRLLQRYGDLDKVRRALNHADVEVTMLYAMADKLLTTRRRSARMAKGGSNRRSST